MSQFQRGSGQGAEAKSLVLGLRVFIVFDVIAVIETGRTQGGSGVESESGSWGGRMI